ncbi:dethiobiotin synthase [Estrella lausannensis]|uniref:ATP-dependent dethiobiotin synthetase BioD n=1 Tax=Estrella lausannensis TaxID=483423 RepID=A0A0H5DRN6_9BACT|nr:dethiobiotin synthase [Estrella lausannensis]CRX38878.1 Dethiobiotin synthetase [Estrella lausannensis]
MTVRPIAIIGIGTGVGKTVVSAIFTYMLKATYWKPVESGTALESDTETIKSLKLPFHGSTYSFAAPLSPDQAAAREGRSIEADSIQLPETDKRLIIEPAGGLLVPLNSSILMLDLLMRWDPLFVITSRHYLGSINHTLLTVCELKRRDAKILGILFNGEEDREKEEAILNFSSLGKLGNLLPENTIDHHTLKKYAEKWKENVTALL